MTYSKFTDFDVSKLSQRIAHKSCIMNICCNGEKGVIIFINGEIIDAEYQDLSVGKAARKLLDLKECEAEISSDNNKNGERLSYQFQTFSMIQSVPEKNLKLLRSMSAMLKWKIRKQSGKNICNMREPFPDLSGGALLT